MKIQTGPRFDGVINNITDLGIFVTLPQHHRGLVHRNDFGQEWLRERQRYQIGQEVRVVVQQIRKGRYDLSIRRVNDPDLPDPANQFSQLTSSQFAQTLNEVDAKAQAEIKQLEAVLAAAE